MLFRWCEIIDDVNLLIRYPQCHGKAQDCSPLYSIIVDIHLDKWEEIHVTFSLDQ